MTAAAPTPEQATEPAAPERAMPAGALTPPVHASAAPPVA